MHKELMILGLLRNRSLHGHELDRILRAHGELYADLKRGNLYQLLKKLAESGFLSISVQIGTRGRSGEKTQYEITSLGRARFDQLLRNVITHFEPLHGGIEVATVFLSTLPDSEALELLTLRLKNVETRQQTVADQLQTIAKDHFYETLAADHILSQIESERVWLVRSVSAFRQRVVNESVKPELR